MHIFFFGEYCLLFFEYVDYERTMLINCELSFHIYFCFWIADLAEIAKFLGITTTIDTETIQVSLSYMLC